MAEVDINQGQLAALSNVSRPIVCQIITGRINATGEEKKAIASVLKKNINQLFPAE